MTVTRTMRAHGSGTNGQSPNGSNFEPLNMTLAFKNTSNENSSKHKHSQHSSSLQHNTSSTGVDSQEGEDASPAGGSGSNSKEDEKEDEDTDGRVHAPPARSHDLDSMDASVLSIEKAYATSNELAGLENKNAGSTHDSFDNLETMSIPRRPSTSNFTESDGNMSDLDFDVADDDDDYAAIDQLSQCSDDDANIEAQDAEHLAFNVNDWNNQDNAGESTKDEIMVDWDDRRTYDFEFPFPYSGHLSDAMDTALPFDSIPAIEASTILSRTGAGFSASDYDPHISQDIFAKESTIVSPSSSSASDSSEAPDAMKISSGPPTNCHEDDTESEDLQEEMERRARMARKRRKSLKKRRRSSNKKDDNRVVSPQASKVSKFTRSPKRAQAHSRLTARGRIISFSFSKETAIRWVAGRVPIDPADTAPSPELTRSLRSRMFQQTYCPAPANVDAFRQLFKSPHAAQSMLTNPDVQSSLNMVIPSLHSGFGSFGPLLDLRSASGNSFDFSDFIDDDGQPGLTLYEDLFAINHGGDNEILNDASSSSNSMLRVSELERNMDHSLEENSVTSPSSHPNEETDVHLETPCAKRRRTITSTPDTVHGPSGPSQYELSNQVTV